MDGNAKHDLEHTAEKSVTMSAKISKVSTIIFGRILVRARRYYQKHFSSSMKALRNDGPTKELYVTPPLTRAEVKQIITACRENNVLMGIKKMSPDGELSNNKSLYQQEKIARNEIKYQKWNERFKTTKKIKIINKFCKSQAEKYKQLSLKDELENSEERYVLIFNKSKVGFLNEQLAKIPANRVKQAAQNELDEIENDMSFDDRNMKPMLSRGMNLSPSDLSKVGEDFGSCTVRAYQKNYCKQKITKEEYCEIREQLFDLRSHGACVLNDNEMLIAFNSDDLEEYKMYAPDKPIKEYGANGARSIETEANGNDIIELDINDIREFKTFKEKYSEKDYLAQYNPDGKITVWVRDKDTKDLVEDSKKKSKTADLVKEADKFAEKNRENQTLENIDLIKEEEQVLDR